MEAAVDLLKGRTADPGVRSRGYVPTGERTTELETDYAKIFHSKHHSEVNDPYNEEYLNKILTMCQEKGVQVILVATPLTDAFLCQYDNFQHFYDWYAELAETWGLRFYDFNLLKGKSEMFPDLTLYFDHLHFNDEGADKFSEFFAELLVRADAGEDLNDLFYPSYAEMEKQVFGVS